MAVGVGGWGVVMTAAEEEVTDVKSTVVLDL